METSSQISNLFSPERKELRKKVWSMALPVMLANITIPLVGLTDTAVMGHFGEAHYIGAVAMGSFMFSLMTIAFGFQRMAVTGLVAQANGAGQYDQVFLTFYRAVMVALALGIGIILLALPVMWLAPLVLAASQDVLMGMNLYLGIISIAGPAICLNMVGLGFLFGLQNIRGCMIQLITVNLVNIASNLILVFGLDMKIEGVALASVFAQYIGVLVTFLLIKKACKPLGPFPKLVFKDIVSTSDLTRYAVLGRDLTIRTFCILLSEVIVLNFASGMSDDALAATQVGFVIFGLMAYSLDGFAHAVEALVGTAIGKKDLAGLRHAVAESTILAGMTSLLMAALIWFGGYYIIRIITSIPSVLDLTEDILIWFALLPVASVWAFMMDGVFVGATKALIMRNAMLVSMAIFLPLVYLGHIFAGLDGIWIAFMVLLGLRGLTLWLKMPEIETAARA